MTEDAGLGPTEAKLRLGDESFHDAGRPLGFDVEGSWRWSFSDLVSNAIRGIVVECRVAEALGVADGARREWAAYDLTAADGIHVEVKWSTFIQSCNQKRLSAITFGVRKARA